MPNKTEVLLVEDNANDAEMIVRALEENNVAASIHRVKDGAEALEFLFHGLDPAKPVDLKVILLDIKLPKVDGIEVLRKIKANDLTKVVPVVILTSSNEPTDRRQTYNFGVNSYIVKPMDFDEFVRAMGQIGKYWLNLNRPAA